MKYAVIKIENTENIGSMLPYSYCQADRIPDGETVVKVFDDCFSAERYATMKNEEWRHSKDTKYFKVSAKQMELLCSIVNEVIKRSAGCKDGEWSVDSNGMIYDDKEMTWGMVCGDDIEDAQENEEDVIDGLKFVLDDCFDEEE